VVIWLSNPATLCVIVAIMTIISYGMVKLSPNFGGSDPHISMITGTILLGMTVISALLLCPLAAVVALNIGAVIYNVPFLLKTLFSIEIPFVTSGAAIVTNATFIALVCGLTYVCLDPLFKAAYAMRCFYGDSLSSGQDLLAELSAHKKTGRVLSVCIACFIVLILCSPGVVQADQGSPTMSRKATIVPKSLEVALDRVINGPSYSWRMVREKAPPAHEKNNEILKAFFGAIIDIIKKGVDYAKDGLSWFAEWIGDLLGLLFTKSDKPAGAKAGRLSVSSLVVIVLLISLLIFAGYLFWRNRKKAELTSIVASVANPTTVPDIQKDDVDANALPHEGWMNMARDYMEKGESRLALRAIYLASLASLSQMNVIVVERYKSDWEYEREVRRKDHAYPGLVGAFSQTRTFFEGSWYGNHPVSMNVLDKMLKNQMSIAGYGQS
jgi:hypothetical protein